MRLLLIGAPGAGKGTQAARLAERFGLAHISSGDLLRQHVKDETALGRTIKTYVDAGDLVPDAVVMDMLRKPVVAANEGGGYVLDGFPRTVDQAQAVFPTARALGVEVQAAIHLDVPRDELVRRLLARKRGSDDTQAVIEHRLQVYQENTVPLLEYYAGREWMFIVDGAESPDAVHVEILGRLKKLAERQRCAVAVAVARTTCLGHAVVMPRQPDAELADVVRLFRGRRRWRHVLAMIIGAVALFLATAVVAARLTHHDTQGLPSLGAGAGVYAAGTLAFSWGGAGGFTRRLAWWLPASLILGGLAVLGFALAAVFSTEADTMFSNGRSEAGSGPTAPPPRPARPGNPSPASGRVLAAELLDRADIERWLGPALPDLQTPGAKVARSRSLAIWRAAPAVRATQGQAAPAVQPAARGRAARSPAEPAGRADIRGQAAVSLTVQYSARRAARLRRGRCPAKAQTVPGLADGGYVRHHDGRLGRVTRVRAGQGDWVVALQLRAPAGNGDPTQPLAADVRHILNLLTAATAAGTAPREPQSQRSLR